MKRGPIKPDDLIEWSEPVTVAGAISDIIDRFGCQAFTALHIQKAIESLPEYKRIRSQSGIDSAIRSRLSRMVRDGNVNREGQYKNSRYTAYRAVKNDNRRTIERVLRN
jgi:hypothetical protein